LVLFGWEIKYDLGVDGDGEEDSVEEWKWACMKRFWNAEN
jgi:hypothetical protein